MLSKNPADTAAYARSLAESCRFKSGSVIGLFGEIGCGKTTFVRGFVSHFGMDDLVTSPTFTILNEYANGKVRILHADLYRLRTPDELSDIGLEDQIARNDITFIEWPENAGAFLSVNTWTARMYFSMGENENERKIELRENK